MSDNADFEGVIKGQVVDKIYSYILCLKKNNNGKKKRSAWLAVFNTIRIRRKKKHCIVEI